MPRNNNMRIALEYLHPLRAWREDAAGKRMRLRGENTMPVGHPLLLRRGVPRSGQACPVRGAATRLSAFCRPYQRRLVRNVLPSQPTVSRSVTSTACPSFFL